ELQRGLLAFDQGDLDTARAHAEKGLALAEKASGPDSPQIGAALRFVGAIHSARGERPEAEKVLARAIAVVEKSYGPEHPDVASGLSLLARTVAEAGDLPRAAGLLR